MMFLPKHTKAISLVRADDLRNIKCQCTLADACACSIRIAIYAHHYLPFMSRYNADIKPIPLPNEFPRFTSENVAFRA